MNSTNLSPLSVDIDAALYDLFAQACEDAVKASVSSKALVAGLRHRGVELAYTARPNKASTPEHRHGYAVWLGLCTKLAAAHRAVPVEAFASVYNGSVPATGTVTVGDETRPVTEWKQVISKAGRKVKAMMFMSLRDDLAEAKLDLAAADLAKAEARAEAEKAETALASGRARQARADADAEAARLDAENAPKGEVAKAKAKAKRLAAKSDLVANEVAALDSKAQEAQEAEFEQRAAWESARGEVERIKGMIDSGERAPSATKTDAEKWGARIDKLLSDVRATGFPTGKVDVVHLVRLLEDARKLCGE